MALRTDQLYWRRDQGKTKTVPLRSSQSGVTRGSSVEHSEVQKLKKSKKHTRLGTLKDLCSEDKHRVRQLIEDLARVGSEKEIIERSLRNEREQNQELLSRMKKQQLELAEEKHQLECELHDSQLKMQSLHMYPHTQDPLHSSQDHLDGYHSRESSNWPQVPASHLPPMIPGSHSQQNLVNIESILTMPSQKPAHPSTHESQSSYVANTSRLDCPFLSTPPTQHRAKFQTNSEQPLPFTETTAVSLPRPSWPPISENESFVAGQPAIPYSTLPCPTSPSLYRSLPRSHAYDTEMQEKADFITPSFSTWTRLPPATPVKQEGTEHHINTPVTPDNTWTGLPPSSLSPDGITTSSREYPCSSRDAETQTTATESIATQTTPHNEMETKIQPPTDIQSPPPSGVTQQLLHQDATVCEPTDTSHNERGSLHLHVPLLPSHVSSSENDVIGGDSEEEALMATALLNARDTVSTIQTIARLSRNHNSSQTVLKDSSVRMEKDCAAERFDSPLDLAVSLNMNQSLSLSEIINRGRLVSPEEDTGRLRTEEKMSDSLQEPDDSQVIKDLFFL